MSFLQAGDDTKAASEQVVFAPDPGALSRALYVSPQQTREISLRNPWAAAAILAIRDVGSLAELRSGRTMLSSLPTTDAIQAFLDGDTAALKAAKLPAGMHAAVSYRLERGPGPVASLIMSSASVDDEGRTLFKAYPDIVLDLTEYGPSPGAIRQQDAEAVSLRQLITRTWKAVE